MQLNDKVQHVYLVGAKSLGAYGGYETFVYKLTEYHQNKENIKYHVACKANGDGCMDESKFEGVTKINDHEFELHNAYFHGHTVGGTNPSLIEALGSTDLNLLVDVGFNKEVAEDCALYWSRKPGSLAKLIDKADQMSADEITEMGRKAKKRVAEEYTWDKICGQYEDVFTNREN